VAPSILFHPAAHPPLCPLSLHDALPLSTCFCSSAESLLSFSALLKASGVRLSRNAWRLSPAAFSASARWGCSRSAWILPVDASRSEEHTSELQSRENLVCRLLLEKKNRP